MEKLNDVLKAFELCQDLDCDNCPYYEGGDCQFQSLAQDASEIIKILYHMTKL